MWSVFDKKNVVLNEEKRKISSLSSSIEEEKDILNESFEDIKEDIVNNRANELNNNGSSEKGKPIETKK